MVPMCDAALLLSGICHNLLHCTMHRELWVCLRRLVCLMSFRQVFLVGLPMSPRWTNIAAEDRN